MSVPLLRITYMAFEASASPIASARGASQGEVEREMGQLQADINAANARLVELVRVHVGSEWWATHDGVRSPAYYLSWRLGLPPARARSVVRCAEGLRELPKISTAFRAGSLSLDQVIALMDVATPEAEEDLLELALGMSGAQLSRFCSHYRTALKAEGGARHRSRFLRTRYTDDGMWRINGELPAEDGAVVERALRAALDALRREEKEDISEPGSAPPEAVAADSDSHIPDPPAPVLDEDAEDPWAAERADALVRMAESVLDGRPSQTDGSDRYLVVIHADAASLRAGEGDASVEDAGSISGAAAARIACDAPVLALLERNGQPLSVGRKTRKVHRGLRRALEARDRGCRFPGCHRRGRIQAHHVEHWARGGETSPENLLSLCRSHHIAVHEREIGIERSGNDFVFRRPDGTLIERPAIRPGSPELADSNRAAGIEVTADTYTPGWGGERGSIRFVTDLYLSRRPPQDP